MLKIKIMKKILVVLFVFLTTLGYSQSESQKKWYSNADLELLIHSNVKYSFNYFDIDQNSNVSSTQELREKKSALGLTYNLNYMVFKKLSLGILTSYKKYNQPDLSIIELGGVARYFFVDRNNVYTYVSVANAFSLDKKQFSSGGNARIGFGLPIVKGEKLNVNVNIFKEQNFLRRKNGDPYIGLSQERPGTLIYNSWGISAGVAF
jgi:hypothetical protein